MEKKKFARKIAEWYEDHKRKLPWRETSDPYRIWLSEIILQQTRVAQGLPYYLKFVERFPDLPALAAAREQDVLRLWQGLGYYSRARNLHCCAKAIVRAGKFPDTFMELRKLPGIGNYTAAAIASQAFQEPVAVVDGNVYRVLSRIFGDEQDIATAKGKSHFFDRAQSLIPSTDPGEFNQAIMEFGALYCTPKNPDCENCIFVKECVAFANGWVSHLPVKTKKSAVRRRYFYYFILERKGKWGMRKRMGKDIWHGLYDFYLVETTRQRKPETLLSDNPVLRALGAKIKFERTSPSYSHLLSHQKLHARFIPVELGVTRAGSSFRPADIQFYSAHEINNLPKPVLVSRYLHDSGFL